MARPEIHGHRGARGLYPENSLAAIRAGIDSGCDAIEVDLCVSADDRLVLIHDPILSPALVRDRTGRWLESSVKVRDCSLAQLQEFDIGRINPDSGYAEKFRSQASWDGTRIPTLDEFVSLVREVDSPVTFNLELKGAPYNTDTVPELDYYADLVVSAIEDHGIGDRTFLQSFDWRLPALVQRHLPEIKIGLISDLQPDGNPQSPICGKPSLWTDGLDLAEFPDIPHMVRQLGAQVWSGNYLDITARNVQSAHSLGLSIYAWTVNTETDMRTMMDYGVDAITTDYPDRLYRILNQG